MITLMRFDFQYTNIPYIFMLKKKTIQRNCIIQVRSARHFRVRLVRMTVPELIKKRKAGRNIDTGRARARLCERRAVPQWLNFSALLWENNAETFNGHRAKCSLRKKNLALPMKMGGREREKKKRKNQALRSVRAFIEQGKRGGNMLWSPCGFKWSIIWSGWWDRGEECETRISRGGLCYNPLYRASNLIYICVCTIYTSLYYRYAALWI